MFRIRVQLRVKESDGNDFESVVECGRNREFHGQSTHASDRRDAQQSPSEVRFRDRNAIRANVNSALRTFSLRIIERN